VFSESARLSLMQVSEFTFDKTLSISCDVQIHKNSKRVY